MPPTSADRSPAVLLPLLTAAAVILGVIAFGLFAAHHPGIAVAETRILTQVAAARVPFATDLSLAIDTVFGPPVAVIVGLLACVVVFVATRRWARVAQFAVLVLGTWLGAEVIKLLVQRPRPLGTAVSALVPDADPFSYPSGHVAFAVGLGFAAVMLIARSRSRRATAVAAVSATLVTAVTALSRVYIGVHFPTDVAAAVIYAAAASWMIAMLWRRWGHLLERTQTVLAPAES